MLYISSSIYMVGIKEIYINQNQWVVVKMEWLVIEVVFKRNLFSASPVVFVFNNNSPSSLCLDLMLASWKLHNLTHVRESMLVCMLVIYAFARECGGQDSVVWLLTHQTAWHLHLSVASSSFPRGSFNWVWTLFCIESLCCTWVGTQGDWLYISGELQESFYFLILYCWTWHWNADWKCTIIQ